jgi:sorting nexin-8
MSLFGTSPPNGNGMTSQSLFDDDDDNSADNHPKFGGSRSPPPAGASSSLFADSFGDAGADYNDGDDEDPSGSSHWSMPPPRRSRSRADVIRTLLAADELPEPYLEAFDAALRDDPVGPGGSRAGAGAVARMFAAARVHPDQQAHIMNIMAADGSGELALDRSEFGVLLALVGLTQEGEAVSLDGVDERRRSECCHLPGDVGHDFFRVKRAAASLDTHHGGVCLPCRDVRWMCWIVPC